MWKVTEETVSGVVMYPIYSGNKNNRGGIYQTREAAEAAVKKFNERNLKK